jgi:hypothetical protein
VGPASKGGSFMPNPCCRARRRRRGDDDASNTRRLEGFMSVFRNALLGLTALGAMATPALAQMPTSYDGVMLYYPDTGRMVMGHVDKASMDMAMEHTKPLNGPVMIVMSGGKAYIVDDAMDKMPDGSRMIDYFDKRTYGNF